MTDLARRMLDGDCVFSALEYRRVIEGLLEDAERWHAVKKQFVPVGLSVTGHHAWQWRGNPARLRGPSMEAAIDAARKGPKHG